jgi:hypothetical protein
LYEHELHPTWPPIDTIFKNIQIGSNFPHIITRTQYSIQLVVTRNVHLVQGLTFDYLTFDPNIVHKHGLTYTKHFRVKKKEFF